MSEVYITLKERKAMAEEAERRKHEIKKDITVKVSYFDFKFEDINEAMAFAETAFKNSAENKSVNVFIEFYKEDDEDEVQKA